MEFGSPFCCGCSWCGWCDFEATALIFLILGSPAGLLLIIRTAIRWNEPWFDGEDLTRIEFPEPQIIPAIPYNEPIPVEMMVGSCSETKRCAYCHEEFDSDSTRRFCFSCGSATHEECATLNSGCSVYGCVAKTLLTPSTLSRNLVSELGVNKALRAALADGFI